MATVASLILGGGQGKQTLMLASTGNLGLLGSSHGRTTNGAIWMVGGKLSGAGDLDLSGSLNWVAGDIEGSGMVEVRGGLVIQTAGSKSLRGRSLASTRNLDWNDGCIETGQNSIIHNRVDSILTCGPGVCTRSISEQPGAILNAGIFRKREGDGTASFEDHFLNSGILELGRGTVRFHRSLTQTDGKTILLGCTLELAAPLALDGGSLEGSGAILGSLGSRATVWPQGMVSISGDYIETEDSRLVVELNGLEPGSGFSQLNVKSLAFLAGTLQLRLRDGFLPPVGSAFAFLQAGAREGRFGRIEPVPSTLNLLLQYDSLGALLIASGPARPTLAHARGTGDIESIILSWPVSSGSWLLEEAPILGAADLSLWVAIPPQNYRTNLGVISCEQPILPAGFRFFRLRSP